jgi:hypothetical protein
MRVMSACVDLAWRGARIRAARLLPEPAILIDEPRPGTLPSTGGLETRSTGGFQTRPYRTPAGPVWCQAHVHGVRVEWQSRGARP